MSFLDIIGMMKISVNIVYNCLIILNTKIPILFLKS